MAKKEKPGEALASTKNWVNVDSGRSARSTTAMELIVRFDQLRVAVHSVGDIRAATAFAASCCERFLGDYAEFQRNSHFGDVAVLLQVVDAVWKMVPGKRASSKQRVALQQKVERVFPDSELDVTAGPTSNDAQEVCLLLLDTLQMIETGDTDKVAGIHVRCFALVQSIRVAARLHEHVKVQRAVKGDAWAKSFWTSQEFQTLNASLRDEVVQSDRHYRAEMEAQLSALAAIAKTDLTSAPAVEQLRLALKGDGTSSAGFKV